MAKARNVFALQPLALALSGVAVRMESEAAAQAAAQAARTLTQAMVKATDSEAALQRLGQALSVVAVRMKPDAAAQAAATLTHAMTKSTNIFRQRKLARGLSAVAAHMEPKEAIATLTQAMVKTTDSEALRELALGLSAVIPGVDRPELSRRSAVVGAVVVPLATNLPLATPALLAPALKPLPCRLSTQALVDLLKQPTCIGQARRIILDQLENRYRQKFADHWAFVRFAQKQKLDLDFTTPPKRLILPTEREEK
jgi:hypothetical protein